MNYYKLASRQDKTRTTVVNEAARDFFGANGLMKKHDELIIDLAYGGSHRKEKVRLVQKQDLRIFIDRDIFEPGDIFCYQKNPNGSFGLTVVRRGAEPYDLIRRKLTNGYFIGELTGLTMEADEQELNQILFGPPGTGKTYHAVNAAIRIVDRGFFEENQRNRSAIRERFRDLLIGEVNNSNGQIGFTTFHQSMSYEDFIEGIKPSKPKDEDTYLSYDVEEGIFKKMCRLADENEDKNYVLIIDEINRGNVSSIFGELITLIEPSKRAGAIESLEVVLPYSKANFAVPKNLYIVGTMNTADRSVEALDSALRRRFAFKEMPPDVNVIAESGKLKDSWGMLEDVGVKVDLVELLETINARIEVLRDKDCLIGHSYLMEVETLEDLRAAFKDKIIPLLQEYFFADLGKLSLILGPSFVVAEAAEDVKFAKGHDYDSVILAEIQERKVYRITESVTWDFEQIIA